MEGQGGGGEGGGDASPRACPNGWATQAAEGFKNFKENLAKVVAHNTDPSTTSWVSVACRSGCLMPGLGFPCGKSEGGKRQPGAMGGASVCRAAPRARRAEVRRLKQHMPTPPTLFPPPTLHTRSLG